MKFLFVSSGYPGVTGANSGSGIGTYLREIALGLLDRGHTCDVLVWGRSVEPTPTVIDGVRVFQIPRGYWRGVERFLPDARNVHARRVAVRRLMAENHYRWIEIQHDEGVDIGIERDFPDETIVRVHTPLVVMVDVKRVVPTYRTRCYLARERRALRLARRIVTHCDAHARRLKGLFPFIREIQVVPHGVSIPHTTSSGQHGRSAATEPRFLLVGTPDLRKGLDRLRPVLEAYAKRTGPCRAVIVSSITGGEAVPYGLDSPLPSGVTIEWRSRLSADELATEYRRATVLLHLARYESFGLPLIEAAAHGLPVVATPTGVAPHLLTNGLSHYLVDGDAPEQVATALATATANRATIAEQIKACYRSSFTREHMVDLYLQALHYWNYAVKSGNRRAQSGLGYNT